MESKRQQKFGKLLLKELSELFQREMNLLIPNVLITITTVRVTPDLSMAKVYLSLLTTANVDETIKLIRSHTKEVRYKLGTKIKDQVRVIPALEFFLDDSLDYAERMDKLLSELQAPKTDRE